MNRLAGRIGRASFGAWVVAVGLALAIVAARPAAAGSAAAKPPAHASGVIVDSQVSFRADPTTLASCGAAGKRAVHALSMGVDHSPAFSGLAFLGPPNETRMVATTLRARGADVLTLMNPDHDRFVAAVNDLLRQTRCGDKVLLHFSTVGQIHPGGPWVIYLPEANESPASAEDGMRHLRGVITGAELRSAVTALRNQGADVLVFLDTAHAEASGLAAADKARAVWSSATAQDAAGADLLPGHGQLAAFYSTDRQHFALEADVSLPGGEKVVATPFALAVSTALADRAVRTARDLAGAVMQSLQDHYRSRGIAPGLSSYVWPVIELTDPDMPLFDAVARDVAPGIPGPRESAGAVSIVIDTPEATRGGARVSGTTLRVAGHLAPATGAAKVFVNGDVASVSADGRFSVATTIDARQKSVRIAAVIAPELRVLTAELPLAQPEAGAAAGGSIRRRFALLIAEQAYSAESGFRQLSTPAGDAEAIGRILAERYGFSTELPLDDRNSVSLKLVNASRRQIMDTLNLLRRHLAADDALLVFYAGHGWRAQNGDIAYWIPVDAESDNWGTYISAVDITSQIRAMAAQHVLLMSDSCYAGALSRGDRIDQVSPPAAAAERERFLEGLYARRARVLVSSGADEPVDDGGGDGHSVFARAVLNGLTREQRPAFTAEELLVEYLKPYVIGNSAQSPQHAPLRGSGHEGGDFVFVRSSRRP